MSKKLIERLRNAAISATSECAWLMTEAADALEAKAAPVGEREAAIDWYNNADWGNECFKDGVVRGFQAGAAYQRAQQPQATDWQPSGADYDRSIHMNPDAKAWADLFVETFPGLADKHELMVAWFANAMMAMHDHLKAQQPSAGVVMPGRAEVSVRYGYRSMGYAEGWNDCLDEVASLNGNEVGRG